MGLLFGVGQLMGGRVAIGQGGLGLFFFMGQMGFGGSTVGQAVGFNRGAEYMKEMNQQFTELLSFRSTRGLPGAE